jgi:hypothetical protein
MKVPWQAPKTAMALLVLAMAHNDSKVDLTKCTSLGFNFQSFQTS